MAALLKRNETRSVIQNGAFLIKEGILIKERERESRFLMGRCPRKLSKTFCKGSGKQKKDLQKF
jgi:hypothetical protein